MTITSKWQLMLSSFSDILAALSEKGFTIPKCEYSQYAKYIKEIIFEDYTPNNSYPVKGTLIDKLIYCNNVKAEIKSAIKSCNIEMEDGLAFNEYGNKIRLIDVFNSIPTTLSSGYAYAPYTSQIQVPGDSSKYTFAYYSGSIPTGITINSDGSITGTTTSTGNYINLKVKITAPDGKSEIIKFRLLINYRQIVADVKVDGGYINSFDYDGTAHTVSVTFTDYITGEVLNITNYEIQIGANKVNSISEPGSYLITLSVPNCTVVEKTGVNWITIYN